jgi:hypothetical protein
MIERKRGGLSAEQKVDLWSRWKAGQSLHDGGIAPAARRKGRKTWDFKLRQIDCKPVLRRPLETTPGSRKLTRQKSHYPRRPFLGTSPLEPEIVYCAEGQEKAYDCFLGANSGLKVLKF